MSGLFGYVIGEHDGYSSLDSEITAAETVETSATLNFRFKITSKVKEGEVR